ncbi:AraC family transcriptional regulator [Paenibacillus qinlingensis]|uniref:AraC family transcriptional regulator n=1 Tax=Paenibacillus qinlingensis TaxID=1837343 RepID=UPI001567853D|nr:AraC family transcriptional regulator [Paenibacillus qinlingensis]NQX58789.1 AraC family transcriptional regulator [Paenibacillus qinlingensis]
MKGFGFYKSKKYLQRVLSSIMLSMVVVLLASSFANTYLLEKSVKRIQEDSNLKILTQMQYNFSYMNEIITHLSYFVLKDNLLIPLMFDETLPKMDLIRGYQRMSSIMDSSSFLHSMVVYNHSQNEIYGTTTNFLLDGGVTKKKISDWLLDPINQHETSRLIPVSLEREDGQIDAFAFVVTESLKPFSRGESAIVLYIKSDWVFDSLKKMNDTGSRSQGDILMADQEGRLYSSHNIDGYGSKATQETIHTYIKNHKSATGDPSGFVIGDVEGEKSMITYMADPIPNWTILYVQSYDQLMAEVTQTRVKSLVVSGVLLLIAIAISVWLSYKLYHPIEDMLHRIRFQHPRGEPTRRTEGDELHAMSENYLKLSHTLQEISSEHIVNKYYIRKFMTDGQMFSHHDMISLIDKHQLNIAYPAEIIVCVLRLDHFQAYTNHTALALKKMHSFAITNIAQEMMSKAYPCEAVEVWGDHIILIVSLMDAPTVAKTERIVPILRDIQHTIETYYDLSLSCGLSDPISQLTRLSFGYTQALQNSLYTLIFGYKSIIMSDMVKENNANKRVSIPEAIERKLSESLKKGLMTEAGIELEKAFSLFATFHYHDIHRAVTNLTWVIKYTVVEIMENRVTKMSFNVDYIHHIPQENETLEEMYLALLALCSQICEGQKPSNVERNDMILETVKELIHQKYADINLSQQTIAATVKLSSAYLGKLFKDSYQLTLTEYINEVRLQHAQHLLENGDHSVLDIMEKCGYANPSYFFRLFKAKFGSTPKEYRMKKSIS